MDIGHAVAEFFGIDPVDHFVANRIDGQNSPGEIIQDAVIVGLSTTKGERVKAGKVEVVIDANIYPEAAAYAGDALKSGVSGEGVIDRSGGKA